MVLSSFMNDVYSEKRAFRFYRCAPKNNDAFSVGIYLFKVAVVTLEQDVISAQS